MSRLVIKKYGVKPGARLGKETLPQSRGQRRARAEAGGQGRSGSGTRGGASAGAGPGTRDRPGASGDARASETAEAVLTKRETPGIPVQDPQNAPYPDVAGSGDKQAKAKLCCVEIDELAVAFGPPA